MGILSRVRLCCLVAIFFGLLSDGQAWSQLRNPDRGRVGVLGARREAREERRADDASARAPAAPRPNGPLANSTQANTPQANGPRSGNALGANAAATANSSTLRAAAANATTSPNATAPRNPLAPRGASAALGAAAASGGVRPASATANTLPSNSVRSAYSPIDPSAALTPRSSLPPTPALPSNQLPYKGPGVVIRLPLDSPAQVHYLVDDLDHLVIRTGEEQTLRLKGEYVIHFSRGDNPKGGTFGEAHYRVYEGIYNFEVTDKGWKLYRVSDIPAAQDKVESRITSSERSPSTEARPPEASPLTPKQPSNEANADRRDSSAETLPPPVSRSILE